MFAHLPMYDVPANALAQLRLWQAFYISRLGQGLQAQHFSDSPYNSNFAIYTFSKPKLERCEAWFS